MLDIPEGLRLDIQKIRVLAAQTGGMDIDTSRFGSNINHASSYAKFGYIEYMAVVTDYIILFMVVQIQLEKSSKRSKRP